MYYIMDMIAYSVLVLSIIGTTHEIVTAQDMLLEYSGSFFVAQNNSKSLVQPFLIKFVLKPINCLLSCVLVDRCIAVNVVNTDFQKTCELLDAETNISTPILRTASSSYYKKLWRLSEHVSLTAGCARSSSVAADCDEHKHKNRAAQSGLYLVQPSAEMPITCVYCHMTVDKGWIAIQRRLDGQVDFQRNWNDCKNGFGTVTGEFWMGNEFIHNITNSGNYELHIDMGWLRNGKSTTSYAAYKSFRIADEQNSYRLNVSGFSGTAGDSLSRQNGMTFKTADRSDGRNCPEKFTGVWWYVDAGGYGCHSSNLNGVFYERGECPNGKGINWLTMFDSYTICAINVTMMIRRST